MKEMDLDKPQTKRHKNVSDSLNTDSIKSEVYGELRKGIYSYKFIADLLIGLSSGDKGVTKAPDSKNAE